MDEKELASVPEETDESTDVTVEAPETPSAPEGGGKKKKKKHRYPFWKRLLIFLLGTIIGFVSCIGAIAGVGYWAYSNLSLQKLNDMGIAVGLPDSLQGTGEVDISTYTIKSLIGDVLYFTGEAGKEKLTIQGLRERYGLHLLSDVEGMLPAELTTLPLGDLASENGLEYLLSALDFSFVLKLLPEGVFSEPFIETMEGRDLGGLASGNMGDMLAGVKLGYLIGATYEKQGDRWVLIPADPAHKTLMEYMAELDLGKVIGESQDENGSVLALLKEELGTVPLSEIMGFSAEGGDILAGVKFGDVIVKNETDGTYSLQIAAAFNDMLFGTLAGYEETSDGWCDENGNEASVLMARIFDHTVGEFASGEFSFDDVTRGLLIGDLMGYTKKANGGFLDESGKDVMGLNAILADVSLDTLINGELAFDTLFDDEKVGTVLNYTQDKRGNWYDADGNPVTGLNASIADITMQQFFGKESLNATDVFAGVYLGEVMGYTVSKYKTDGKTPDKWIDADGKEVDSLNADVANLKVGDLSDGEGVDFKEVFGDELIGDMQGHTYNPSKDHWYTAEGVALETLENAIAQMTVAEIIDGNIDFAEAFGDEKIGNLQNYVYVNGQWYKDAAKTQPLSALDNVIASWSLNEVMNGNVDYKESMKDVYLGEMMGYTGSVGNWRDGNKKVIGLSAVVADLQFGSLDNDKSVTEVLSHAKVGDVMGYHREGTKWYDEEGNEVATILALLADKKVEEMNDTINDWQLGHLMGYEKRAGSWYNPDGDVNDMMLHVADLYLKDLSDPDAIHASIDEMHMSDILNYTQGADGNWYHGTERVTGVTAYLASHAVKDLPTDMNEMTVADVFGYEETAGVWYDADGHKLDHVMVSIADAKIIELDDRMQTITVGELFERSDDGFFKILGGETKLAELDDRIDVVFGTGADAATIGDFMDAGIIDDVDAAESAKLDHYLGTSNWRDMQVTAFINSVISIITTLP